LPSSAGRRRAVEGATEPEVIAKGKIEEEGEEGAEKKPAEKKAAEKEKK